VPGSISLRPRDRNALLHLYRHTSDPQARLRAHILLLLAEGYPWALTAAVLFTSARTINRWRECFLAGGLETVVGRPVPRATGRPRAAPGGGQCPCAFQHSGAEEKTRPHYRGRRLTPARRSCGRWSGR
jgi:hypothetical protein